jgi:eukaryotic-like serine/threonine-protein kinase
MTTAQRNMQAFEVFAAVCDLPADQRPAALREKCAGDAELLAMVEKMLGADPGKSDSTTGDRIVDDFLQDKVRELAPDPVAKPESSSSEHGSQYRILRVIGEGGMGTVYEAEQTNPRRRVAIKAIRPGRVTPQIRRRFEYEAQILGRLEHPGIARLYETDSQLIDGELRIYLAMELIHGKPIDEYAVTARLTTKDKLLLMTRVCEAIAYAHRMGVIHRDLKPGNILVESGGQPKVLDFGVARSIDSRGMVTTQLTQTGQIIGTLTYMSPEQVEATGQPDTRSDVYALGVILYKLLSGTIPIDVRDHNLLTAARMICEETPKLLGDFDRSFKGDIERVVAKALEKKVGNRYASIEAFSDDLHRIITGQPVAARSHSRLYVYRTVASRYKNAIALAGVFVATLAGFGVYSFNLARQNQLKSQELSQSLYVSRVGFAYHSLINNDVSRVRYLLDECPPEHRRWEWHYINLLLSQSLRTQTLPVDGARHADWSEDRTKMVVASLQREVLLFDTTNGTTRLNRKLPDGTPRVAITRDGKWMAFGGFADTVTLVNTADLSERAITVDPPTGTNNFERRMRAIQFSPDGKQLTTANLVGVVSVHDVESGKRISTFNIGQPAPLTMIFDRTGESLLVGNEAGELRRYDAKSGAVLQSYFRHTAPIHTLALSRTGYKLVSGDAMGQVAVWDVDTARELYQIRIDNHWITSVALSPDDKFLAIGRADAGLSLWDTRTRFQLCQLRGHTRGVAQVWFDNDRIYSVGIDSEFRTWLAEPSLISSTIESGQKNTLGVAFMPDGGSVFSAGTDGTIRRWDVHSLKELSQFNKHVQTCYYVSIDAAGKTMASSGRDRTVKVWDIASGQVTAEFKFEKHVLTVALSPDGKSLVAGDVEGMVYLLDPSQQKIVWKTQLPGRLMYSAHFHPDSKRFITGGGDGKLRIWSIDKPQPLGEVVADKVMVREVRFSADGSFIATSGESARVATYRTSDLGLLREFSGHVGLVTGIAIHPDGTRLATSGQDRTIRIWDLSTGTEMLTLRGHSSLVQRLSFSPDGKTLASTSDDGTVKIWRGE